MLDFKRLPGLSAQVYLNEPCGQCPAERARGGYCGQLLNKYCAYLKWPEVLLTKPLTAEFDLRIAGKGCIEFL